MSKDTTLFGLIEDYANQNANGQKLNALHYLFGYTKLLEMRKDTLRAIVEPEEIEQYENLLRIIDDLEIDMDIMKRGMPILMEKQNAYKDINDLLLELKITYSGKAPIDVLFQKIIEKESFVTDVFHRGKTMEDILNYNEKLESGTEEKKSLDLDALEEEISRSIAKQGSEMKDVQEQEVLHEQPTTSEKAEQAEPVEQQDFGTLAERCDKLYSKLKEYVYGQDEAIRIFTKGYFQTQVLSGNEKSKRGPKGLFLFAGPPGVGKTYLATVAAESLEMPSKRFNMSEYSDHQSATELIGLSQKYNGAKPGMLTEYVKNNPNSFIIFDEIEKAHLNVIHLFLQILDEGCLQDSFYEKNIDFKNTLVIFTTNVGKRLYEENKEQNLSLLSQSVILDALQNEKHPLTGHTLFPAAICSRFATGNVVMFNHLSSHYLMKITWKNFEECKQSFQEKYGIGLSFDKKLASTFLFHMSSNMDARIISSQSGNFIRSELFEFARQSSERVDFQKLKTIHFIINENGADEKVVQLFSQQKIEQVLVVARENLFDVSLLDRTKIQLHYAKDVQEMEKCLVERDIRFVLIDPMFGYREGIERGVFSVEDYDTEGISCFDLLREKMPHIPVYMLETDKRIREVDRSTFQQLGAYGVIRCIEEEGKNSEADLMELLNSAYLQEKVNELARQEKVLQYDTAQMISENGESAVIEFYDFKLHTAVKADNKDMVLTDAEKPDVKFSDIIGAQNAKDELKFFINYLKNPKEFMMRGVKAPKGILLYGPPGTGKTMLAKAMAGEADVTFLATSSTDFARPYVGEGEAVIRKLFATAKKYAPSVIFIDEIDAIAKERTGSSSTHHTEKLLNTLLTEMDGFSFDPHRPVFVMAATNFPIDKSESDGRSVIDPALLRRFANKIYVDLPDEDERKEFLCKRLAVMANNKVTEDAISNIASRSTGESLAVLQNILDLALRTAEKKGVALDDSILLDAMEEYYYGEEHKWGRDYYESVAHHEAGHAYILHLSGKKPAFVTIVSRGNFGGYMQHSAEDKTPSYSKEDLIWRIRTALAGRAAEIVFYGEEAGTNTGVSSDLENATNIVFQMICRYGMFGNSLLSISPERMLNSPSGAQMLEQAQQILAEEMENTIRLIEEGREKMERLVGKLLEKNQLMANEIEDILNA